MVRALAVIPARFTSTRLPGKPLAPLGGMTLLERVWRQTRAAKRIERIIVATDDERIRDAALAFGAEVLMTDPGHASGTDRVAEVSLKRGRTFDVVINVQGDEPFVTPTSLDRLVEAFESDPPDMATLAEPIENADELFDPNVVKVVTAFDGSALYFSRAPIPYFRAPGASLDADFRRALSDRPEKLDGYLKHQGIYAYRLSALLAITRLHPSPLERIEGLEQLRALQAGLTLRVIRSDFRSLSVDTPEDLRRAEIRLAEGAP